MLRVLEHPIRNMEWDGEAVLREGSLMLVKEELAQLAAHGLIASTDFHIAKPGEEIRIVRVLDAVQPRAKEGDGEVFPGFQGPARVVGKGTTHILSGCAVVSVSYLPRAQESIIEMAGPGSKISPLAENVILVVECKPREGVDWREYEAAVRVALLRVAVRLGEIAAMSSAEREQSIPPSSTATGLPVIGHIYNLQAQGAFKDTFVYGRSASLLLPTLITPGELLDGAVVSGNYGHPSLKNSTYAHLTNPIVAELLARDGHDLRFGGIIVKPEPTVLDQKALVAEYAANLASSLGWQGAIITKEGGGNADIDLFLGAEHCERLGIRAALLMAELAGPDGRTPPLLDSPPGADALVSLGNYEEPVNLPPCPRVIGGDTLRMVEGPLTGPLVIPTAAFVGALSPLGLSRLQAQAD